MKVKDLMTKEVSVANLNTSLSDIASQMKNLDVGSVPVCDSDYRALGIVTDRDIVVKGVLTGNIDVDAKDIMSKDLIYATSDMDAHQAANLMANNQIRRLPVVDNEKLVGMLSIGDLATVNVYVNEAGDALSDISQPSNTSI